MMRKKPALVFIYLLIPAFSLGLSCDEADTLTPSTLAGPLDGTWELSSITCDGNPGLHQSTSSLSSITIIRSESGQRIWHVEPEPFNTMYSFLSGFIPNGFPLAQACDQTINVTHSYPSPGVIHNEEQTPICNGGCPSAFCQQFPSADYGYDRNGNSMSIRMPDAIKPMIFQCPPGSNDVRFHYSKID